MDITLTGVVGIAFILFVGTTAVTILMLGTWVVWHEFIFEFLIPRALIHLKVYHRLVLFIVAYERLQARKRRRKMIRDEVEQMAI